MGGEVDAAGAAITAGMVAAAVEGGEGKVGDRHSACANCGAGIVGRFCHACGQPAHIHRSLLHLFEEALHGLFHLDTKAWRTFPMLAFRPGTLTRQYVHGRRAHFVSPVAAFLFSVFAMFVAFAFLPPTINPTAEGAPRARAEARLQELRDDRDEAATALAEAQAALAQAQAKGEGVPEAERALGEAERERRQAEAALRIAHAGLTAAGGAPPAETDSEATTRAAVNAGVSGDSGQVAFGVSGDTGTVFDAEDEKTWQEQWIAAVDRGDVSINFGDSKTEEKIRHKLRNPDLMLYKLQQTAYKFSFLLIPISLPFVALLFLWRKGLTLFDHGAFTLYSLSFMSLLFIVVNAFAHLPRPDFTLPWLLTAVSAAHMFFHLKGAYDLSIFSALWRTVALLLFAGICLALFASAIIMIGLFS